ncbi:MAG: GNAT family N-acetyltransferase [Cellulosilyticum sp.]|nr:GNAT family N-acetyltransferase [Cellulosilyticum sp.]
MIQIREATIEDAKVIHQITQEELGYDYPLEQLREHLQTTLISEREKVFVAEYDYQVVGYIHAHNYDSLFFEPMKNLLGLAVFSQYHRKGIGTMLLEAVEQWGRNTGAYGIRVNSAKVRSGAHAFYRLQGYNEEKEQLRFIKKIAE